MSSISIQLENVAKVYRLGEYSTGTMVHDFNRWWQTKILKREDSYKPIVLENDRTTFSSNKDYVYALKDVNLDVKQGELLGLVGRNGAGKSTLLKLLSRITAPTSGSIKMRGRMASLLEVGTGFHPELTGRENIYMNGTLLGMRKSEIDKKLDEIIHFSGVAKYIDTPIKRYSSGMTVRLGFAVAAHLDSEILVVDEVLAVGDLEFQKKAIGKMQEVSQGFGKTVLFVSHNMEAVKRLCTKVALVHEGTITSVGTPIETISTYLQRFHHEKTLWEYTIYNEIGQSIELDVLRVQVQNQDLLLSNTSEIFIVFDYKIKEVKDRYRFVITLINNEEIELFSFSDYYIEYNQGVGIYRARIKLPTYLLNKGKYIVRLRVDIPQKRIVVKTFDAVGFEILSIAKEQLGEITSLEPKGLFHFPVQWDVEELV